MVYYEDNVGTVGNGDNIPRRHSVTSSFWHMSELRSGTGVGRASIWHRSGSRFRFTSTELGRASIWHRNGISLRVRASIWHRNGFSLRVTCRSPKLRARGVQNSYSLPTPFPRLRRLLRRLLLRFRAAEALPLLWALGCRGQAVSAGGGGQGRSPHL